MKSPFLLQPGHIEAKSPICRLKVLNSNYPPQAINLTIEGSSPFSLKLIKLWVMQYYLTGTE